VLLLKLVDDADFVLGHELGIDSIDAELFRDRLGDGGAVAGQHDAGADALGVQAGDGVGGVGARDIRKHDHADRLVIAADLRQHEPFGCQRRDARIGHQIGRELSDVDVTSIDAGGRASAGQRGHFACFAEGHPARARFGDDGGRGGVRALCIDCRGQEQNRLLVE
jgi:hypothetical protein